MLNSTMDESIVPFENFPENLIAAETKEITVLVATALLLNLAWFLAYQTNHKI